MLYNLVMKINEKLFLIQDDDSFFVANEKIVEYKKAHPNNNVVSLGVGDVYFPVCQCIADKMAEAVKKQTTKDFVGYGYHYGMPELIEAIRKNEYPQFSNDEIYVSDGAKSDAGTLLELFDPKAKIGIFTPTYPIYINSVYSYGRDFELIKCDENFNVSIPNKHFDILYVCSPNNPTGVNYPKDFLEKLVEYCLKEDCVIFYDNVYFRFVSEGIKSIYEIKDADKCAIEMRSFSKHASFTGVRCSYYVIPKGLHEGINKYWKFRTINRFNGASFIAQAGALASFDEEAQKYMKENLKYYKENAEIIRNGLKELGYEIIGGIDAPYLWVKCKNNLTGWEVFEKMLNDIEVVVLPGSIFGKECKNYFRVSALGRRENIDVALRRLKEYETKGK